jgi:hypothetical protein
MRSSVSKIALRSAQGSLRQLIDLRVAFQANTHDQVGALTPINRN